MGDKLLARLIAFLLPVFEDKQAQIDGLQRRLDEIDEVWPEIIEGIDNGL